MKIWITHLWWWCKWWLMLNSSKWTLNSNNWWWLNIYKWWINRSNKCLIWFLNSKLLKRSQIYNSLKLFIKILVHQLLHRSRYVLTQLQLIKKQWKVRKLERLNKQKNHWTSQLLLRESWLNNLKKQKASLFKI